MNFSNVSSIALLAVIACASAIPHSRLTEADITGCERACPDIYLPVCGFNNKEYKIFDNDCSMETVNCIQQVRHNAVFIEKSMNLCEKVIDSVVKKNCDRICPATFIPVCGFDGRSYKTYANTCQFDVMNCESDNHLGMVSMGECPQEKENTETNQVKNDCNKACTLEYNPICAFNGLKSETYGNMCMFETANCESNYKLRITRMGECSEVPEINAAKKNCDRICPATFIPVCGFDGRSYKTYANTCQFDVMNCESDNHLRMVSMGECPQEKENTETNQAKNDCNKACTLEYNPICAFNGLKSETYGNMCMFETANCESNYKLRITRMGECSEVPEINAVKKNCDRICPATFIPVCGFDGRSYKTYANTCQFDVMNCESDNHLRMVSMGECPQEKENTETNQAKNDCNKACTLEYNPICGFDGFKTETYGNMCMFETANCESNNKLRIARFGECHNVDKIPQLKEIKPECIRPCPASYVPVCVFDGKSYHTYGNTCEFEMMNCDSPIHVHMMRNGEC